jgi:hypothetical protein
VVLTLFSQPLLLLAVVVAGLKVRGSETEQMVVLEEGDQKMVLVALVIHLTHLHLKELTAVMVVRLVVVAVVEQVTQGQMAHQKIMEETVAQDHHLLFLVLQSLMPVVVGVELDLVMGQLE